MFVVRNIELRDLDTVLELASMLNMFNLPPNKKEMSELIEKSQRSFSDPTIQKKDALYMFVLEDIPRKLVLGTSLIFAKHGTPESPHTYLKVLKKIHRDPSTATEREHTLLRFEYDTDGPSEIGGLILHPDYRGLPVSLGRHLSYTRFLYMGLHLDRFEKNVIAELLPPFRADGSSDLWESFGRRFTGLPYWEADRLSKTNKDFIKNLFPQEDIYTCLFDEKAQAVIGQTNPSASPVRNILEKVGFNYLEAVDPFDGGPHYGAKTSEVTLIKRIQKSAISKERLTSMGQLALVAFEDKSQFYSFQVHVKVRDNLVEISNEFYELLKNYGSPQSLACIVL